MAKELMSVTTVDVAPGKEEELNDWYDNVHLPEILACPGINGARRYESIAGEPKFLTIYEIDREDAFETPEVREVYGWGPLTPFIRNSHSRIYRPMGS